MPENNFNQILNEMILLHDKKNSDYGNAWHEEFKEFGVICGILRLYEKTSRLKAIYKKGYTSVSDESLDDTLIDIANYAVMTLAELKLARNSREGDSPSDAPDNPNNSREGDSPSDAELANAFWAQRPL